jgi:hypothetical protein
MPASPGRLRAKALLLLLILLVGGFGLPITDAVVFHSAAGAPATTRDGLSACHDAGPAHLLGCAVWSSPATSTGLPGVPLSPVASLSSSPEPDPQYPAVFTAQTDRTPALPRAPPAV